MVTSSEHTNEERALDALMAAAFRAEDEDRPYGQEEASRILEEPPALSPEDEQIVAAMGDHFVEALLRSAETGTPEMGDGHEAMDEEIDEAYAAMNRGREGDGLDEEALREIERKRRELLGELDSEVDLDEGLKDGT